MGREGFLEEVNLHQVLRCEWEVTREGRVFQIRDSMEGAGHRKAWSSRAQGDAELWCARDSLARDSSCNKLSPPSEAYCVEGPG